MCFPWPQFFVEGCEAFFSILPILSRVLHSAATSTPSRCSPVTLLTWEKKNKKQSYIHLWSRCCRPRGWTFLPTCTEFLCCDAPEMFARTASVSVELVPLPTLSMEVKQKSGPRTREAGQPEPSDLAPAPLANPLDASYLLRSISWASKGGNVIRWSYIMRRPEQDKSYFFVCLFKVTLSMFAALPPLSSFTYFLPLSLSESRILFQVFFFFLEGGGGEHRVANPDWQRSSVCNEGAHVHLLRKALLLL